METFLQGRKLSEVFSSFEKTPVGAGCVAQVHRAVLRADSNPRRSTRNEPATDAGDGEQASGAVLAVKVKRRGVDAAVARDLRLMRSGAALVAALPIPGIRCVCSMCSTRLDPPPPVIPFINSAQPLRCFPFPPSAVLRVSTHSNPHAPLCSFSCVLSPSPGASKRSRRA